MAADLLLVDTSILVEATDAARVHHRRCVEILELSDGLVFSTQVAREYLAVATRPVGANGLGLSTAHALENLRAFRQALRLLPEERPLLRTLLEIVSDTGCAGKRIHDAHIVAAAVVHGVSRILTLNPRDFAAFAPRVTAVGLADIP